MKESYTGLARALTEAFPDRPRVTRHNIYAWSKRRTRNKLGQPFPVPYETVEKVNDYDPTRFWLVAEVAQWYEPGTPDRYGHAWRE